MAQMCLVSDRAVLEGWAGTFITPLRPSGGFMSSVLLTEFIGEFSWNINTQKHTRRQVTMQPAKLKTSKSHKHREINHISLRSNSTRRLYTIRTLHETGVMSLRKY